MSKEITSRTRFTIDVSDWGLGDWVERLWEKVTVEKTNYSIEIEIDNEGFEEVVRKIVKEAIESYINDANWELRENGLEISDINYQQEFIVPLENVTLENYQSANAWKSHIDKVIAEWKADKKGNTTNE
jgi:hypothetical protein